MENLKKTQSSKGGQHQGKEPPDYFFLWFSFFTVISNLQQWKQRGEEWGVLSEIFRDAGFPRLCRRKQPLILEINTEVIQRDMKISSSGPSSKTQTAGAEQLQEG